VKKDLHVATVSTYKCEKEVSFCQMNPTVLLVKKKAMALQMKMKLPFYLWKGNYDSICEQVGVLFVKKLLF